MSNDCCSYWHRAVKELSTADLRESCVFATEHKQLAAHGIWRIGHTVVKRKFLRKSSVRDQKFGHVHLCLSGTADVEVAGRWHVLRPGQAYICPPGENWQWSFHDDEKPWRVVFARLIDGKDQSLLFPERHPYIAESNRVDLVWAYKKLSHESTFQARPVILSCLAEMIHFHCREMISRVSFNDRLGDLWNDIVSSLSHKWTINMMVERSGMGKESLRTRCIKETGRSPIGHLSYLRMQKACHLLVDQNISLEEIAQMVGYETAFSFSRAFMAHTGMRPSVYRKQNR